MVFDHEDFFFFYRNANTDFASSWWAGGNLWELGVIHKVLIDWDAISEMCVFIIGAVGCLENLNGL